MEFARDASHKRPPRVGVLVARIEEGARPFARQTRFLWEAASQQPFAFGVLTPAWLLAGERCEGQGGWVADAMVWSGDGWERRSCRLALVYDRFFAQDREGAEAYEASHARLAATGVMWLNPLSFTRRSQDKWESHRLLRASGLATPETWLLEAGSTREQRQALLGSLPFGYLKPRTGSHGIGIWRWHRHGGGYILRGEGAEQAMAGGELIAWFGRQSALQDYVVQPDVTGSDRNRGDELRLWLQRDAGGRMMLVAGALRRAAPGAGCSNLAQGGRYLFPTGSAWEGLTGSLDEGLQGSAGSQGRRIRDEVGKLWRELRYAMGEEERWVCELAVDLIETPEGWRCLEFNSKPGRALQTLEEAAAKEARRALVTGPFVYFGHLLEEQDAQKGEGSGG